MTRNVETDRPFASLAGLVAVVLGLAAVGGLIAALWSSDDETTVPQLNADTQAEARTAAGLLQGAPPDPRIGVVANEVRGRIVDPNNRPVLGLRVLVDGAESGVPCDDDARFVVRDLGIGAHTFLPTDSFEREVGLPVQVEITAAVLEYEVLLRVPESYPIAGRVVTPDGAPVPDLRIELWQAIEEVMSVGVDPTDVDGRFEARVSAPGNYFAKFQGNKLVGTGSAGKRDVTFVYEADAREDFLIRVVGPDGQPIPSCRIAFSPEGKGPPQLGATLYPVNDGLFRAHPNQWEWAEKMNFYVDDFRDATDNPLPYPLTVRAGVAVADGTVTIVVRQARTMSIRVVDQDGVGVPDARIAAYLAPSGPILRARGTGVDSEGRVVLTGIPASGISIHASAPDYLKAKGIVVPPEQDHVEITLQRGATFRVTVVGAEGSPVAGVRVQLRWHDESGRGYARAKTDPKGVARCTGIPVGVLLSVDVNTSRRKPRIPGWYRRDVPFGDGTLAVILPSSVPFGGTLVGTPAQLAEMTVAMQGADESTRGPIESVKPDPKTGVFQFRSAVPGTYRVWVPSTLHGRAAGVETRATAPTTDVRVLAPTSVAVRGTLEADNPRGWDVRWWPAPRSLNSVRGRRVTVGAEGYFRIRGVRAGTGALVAHSPDRTRVAFLKNVATSDAPFQLHPIEAQTIRGRAREVPKGVDVWVVCVQGPITVFAPIAKGAFEANGLPPGLWSVELWSGHQRLDRMEGVDHSTDVVLHGSK